MSKSGTFFDHIRRTADDLTTLEINTIIKEDMTCFKPPDNDRMVLYMLGKTYHYKLKELGELYLNYIESDQFRDEVKKECRQNMEGTMVELNLFRRKIEFAGGGIFSFRELSCRAGNAIKWIKQHAHQLSVSEEQRKQDIMLLSRIEGKSFEVCRAIEKMLKIKDNALFEHYKKKYKKVEENLEKGMTVGSLQRPKMADHQHLLYQELNSEYKKVMAEISSEQFLNPKNEKFDFEFDIRDKLLIRKSIDIGVEKVVLQTRISMDGDITTRISENFAAHPNQFILDLHNNSISTSVAFWNKLFDALIGFGKKLIDKSMG